MPMNGNFTKEIQYRKIAERIRETIVRNRLKPGTPLLSTRKLAGECGISIKTAQNAIAFLAAEGTVYRVGGSGTFVGPRPRSERLLRIGCTLRPISENRNEKLNVLLNYPADQAVEHLRRHNCEIRYLPTEIYHRTEDISSYLTGLDGILLSGASVSLDECFQLNDLKIPCVVFQSDVPVDYPVSQVVPDHLTGLRKIFRLSRRRYGGFLSICGDFPNGFARRDAFRKVALEFGYPSEAVKEITLDSSQSNAYSPGRRLANLCHGKLIFSCSDCFTADLIRALDAAGKQFGRDYEIISYDNSEGVGFRPFPEPIITSVFSDNVKCAVLAAKLLLEKIRDPDSTTTIIRVPTELAIRKTALQWKGDFL